MQTHFGNNLLSIFLFNRIGNPSNWFCGFRHSCVHSDVEKIDELNNDEFMAGYGYGGSCRVRVKVNMNNFGCLPKQFDTETLEPTMYAHDNVVYLPIAVFVL